MTIGVLFYIILFAQVLWILTIPTILIIAACKLWSHCSLWIPSAFIATAIMRLTMSIPALLIPFDILVFQQHAKIFTAFSLANTIANLVFCIAVLALAIRIRKRQN